jgi:cytoskeletal protein CcmA (bactofilin family)
MFKRSKLMPASIETLLGPSARVQGDVNFAGALHLDGCVAGSVRSPADGKSTLSISEGGRVEGAVDVPNVLLNGLVRGDIRASGRVVLGARARVHGNVFYGVIEMALGAEVRGRLVPAGPSPGTSRPQLAPKPA